MLSESNDMALTLVRLAESGNIAEGVDWLDSIDDACERALDRPLLEDPVVASSTPRVFGMDSGSTTSTDRRLGGVVVDCEPIPWPVGDRDLAA